MPNSSLVRRPSFLRRRVYRRRLRGDTPEHERFEIDGANAARGFLERHSLPEEQVMTVWESIALHTTRQVPNYKQSEVRLVALGVKYDLYGAPFDALTAEQRDAVLATHPRTKFESGRSRRSPRASATAHTLMERLYGHPRSDRARLRAQPVRAHPERSLRDVTPHYLSQVAR